MFVCLLNKLNTSPQLNPYGDLTPQGPRAEILKVVLPLPTVVQEAGGSWWCDPLSTRHLFSSSTLGAEAGAGSVMASKITTFPAGRARRGRAPSLSPARRRWGSCGSVIPQETTGRDGRLGSHPVTSIPNCVTSSRRLTLSELRCPYL